MSTVIRSHGRIQLAPFAGHDSDEAFTYLDRLKTGRVVLLRVQPEGDGVRVTADGDRTGEEQVEVADKVTWMVGLDRDLSPFYAVAEREPKLAHVIAQARGRILRSPTLFEDTMKTILTTNTETHRENIEN